MSTKSRVSNAYFQIRQNVYRNICHIISYPVPATGLGRQNVATLPTLVPLYRGIRKRGVAPYHIMSYQNGHNRSDQNRQTWHIILHRPMYAYTCPLTSGRGEQCRELRLTTYPGPGSVWETLGHPRME